MADGRQNCDGCHLWPQSLEGRLAAERDGIVELSIVGRMGAELGMESGTEVRLFRPEKQHAVARSGTPSEALRLAQEQIR